MMVEMDKPFVWPEEPADLDLYVPFSDEPLSGLAFRGVLRREMLTG